MSILVELPEDQYSTAAFAEFSPRAGFNIGTARAMAWMSQLAYETRLPEKVERIGRRWGLENIRPFKQPARSALPISSAHGVLAMKNDALIIAFAGIDPLNLNLLNWITDFYMSRPSVNAQDGFQDAAAAVWTEVGTAVELCIDSNRPLFVAGHSLGAAIAVVTADRAHSEKKLRQAEIYIFGSPRVGKSEFVNRYNSNFGLVTYRFVHGKDIIPTVPPPELGFHHVGRLLQCERGKRFEPLRLLDHVDSDEPSPGDDLFTGIAERVRYLFGGLLSPTLRIDALGQLSLLLVPSIGDHLPDRYYNALMS